jgi:hypothetical protein
MSGAPSTSRSRLTSGFSRAIHRTGSGGECVASYSRTTSGGCSLRVPLASCLRLGVGTLAHRSVSYHLRVEAGVRTGGCLCGAVRYSVRGDPVHVGRCHCADCRKESGSAFIVYGQWPVEAFEVSGEISSYGGRGFCPLCGSRLLDPVGPGDTLIEIRLGSLDEAPFELKPEAEVWVKRRESWLLPVEGAAQHDENRP